MHCSVGRSHCLEPLARLLPFEPGLPLPVSLPANVPLPTKVPDVDRGKR